MITIRPPFGAPVALLLVASSLAGQRPVVVWQHTGWETTVRIARADSAAALALLRAVKNGDFTFYELPAGGPLPGDVTDSLLVGRQGVKQVPSLPAHASARERDALSDFVAYYNRLLERVLAAPPDIRRCFASADTPWVGCSAALLPMIMPVPAPLKLASLSLGDRRSVLEAVLKNAIRGDSGSTIVLDAAVGSDGFGTLTAVQDHDAGWLRSLVKRGIVACTVKIRGDRIPACGQRRVVTVVRIGLPRRTTAHPIVVHVSTATRRRSPEDPTGCCLIGAEFDAFVSATVAGWTVDRGPVLFVN